VRWASAIDQLHQRVQVEPVVAGHRGGQFGVETRPDELSTAPPTPVGRFVSGTARSLVLIEGHTRLVSRTPAGLTDESEELGKTPQRRDTK